MTPEDAAATKRVAGIVRWLKERAKEHDRKSAQLGGVGYPAGQEAALRASECRAVAVLIAESWT